MYSTGRSCEVLAWVYPMGFIILSGGKTMWTMWWIGVILSLGVEGETVAVDAFSEAARNGFYVNDYKINGYGKDCRGCIPNDHCFSPTKTLIGVVECFQRIDKTEEKCKMGVDMAIQNDQWTKSL